MAVPLWSQMVSLLTDRMPNQTVLPGKTLSQGQVLVIMWLNNKNAHGSIHLIPHSCLCLLTLNVYLLIGICIVFVAILGLD